MDLSKIIKDIEDIGIYIKKNTNSYIYEGDLTSIIDNNLNAKNLVLLKNVKDYGLDDYYDILIKNYNPICHNAIEYVEYINSIKKEIIECSKWNDPKSRLNLINNIAYTLQEKYTIYDINILFNSVGIVDTDDKVPSSKRLYVQQILGKESISKILKLAKSEKILNEFIDLTGETNILKDEYLEKQIDKCITKVNSGDYDGAITNARTMIEEILLKIEEEITGIEGQNPGNLPKLYKRVRKLLNLEPNDDTIENALNEILLGFVNIISGISGISNSSADRHACKYRPDKRHAELVVNACLTFGKFLISSYEYQCLD